MRCTLLIAVSIAVGSGCQLGPRWSQHLDLLDAEKRSLEDDLYALRYDLEDARGELQKVRRENVRLRQRLGMPESGTAKPDRSSPNRDPTSSGPDLSPPRIDEGVLTEPRIEIPEDSPPPSPPGSASSQPRAVPRELPVPSSSFVAADPRVTHLYLNPLLTGGGDFDRQPGDDGLIVVVEPRNRDNVFVPLAGPISVVLLDPEQKGDLARFAKWEVDAAAVQTMIQHSGSAKGIHLRLPWPHSAPSNSRLRLFVRYGTVDGRKLEIEREVFIALPGQITQRWTPRSSRRGESMASAVVERASPSSYLEPVEAESMPAPPAAPPVPPNPLEQHALENSRPGNTADPADSGSARARTALPEWRPYR